MNWIKYYSRRRFHDPVAAQKHADKLQERHPDREYAVLVNTRAFKSFSVAEVQTLSLRLATEDDLGLPPRPSPPPGNAITNAWAWQDYRHEIDERVRVREAANKAALDRIKQALH